MINAIKARLLRYWNVIYIHVPIGMFRIDFAKENEGKSSLDSGY